jgi:very-short-patch-repair endonuclease
VWRALRKANLDPPRLQLEVHHAGHYVMRVDFAWPRQRIALHADSFLWHARRDAFDTDARQRSVLASIGWANVIVTRHSLRERTWLQLLERLLHERRPQLTFSL